MKLYVAVAASPLRYLDQMKLHVPLITENTLITLVYTMTSNLTSFSLIYGIDFRRIKSNRYLNSFFLVISLRLSLFPRLLIFKYNDVVIIWLLKEPALTIFSGKSENE